MARIQIPKTLAEARILSPGMRFEAKFLILKLCHRSSLHELWDRKWGRFGLPQLLSNTELVMASESASCGAPKLLP
jgi:hypothetical protein